MIMMIMGYNFTFMSIVFLLSMIRAYTYPTSSIVSSSAFLVVLMKELSVKGESGSQVKIRRHVIM